MSAGVASEPPLSLPPEMLRELESAGVEADQAPSLEQWQTLLLRFAHAGVVALERGSPRPCTTGTSTIRPGGLPRRTSSRAAPS